LGIELRLLLSKLGLGLLRILYFVLEVLETLLDVDLFRLVLLDLALDLVSLDLPLGFIVGKVGEIVKRLDESRNKSFVIKTR
jgi:hypothetical protein